MKQLILTHKQGIGAAVCFCCLFFIAGPLYAANTNQPQPVTQPKVEDLGNGRYRIGSIEVDKTSKSFSVSGVVLRDEPPLEFLVVTKGGMKGYESLLELNANAFEFNLACILIGLDPKKGVAPSFHFAPEPAQGDAVGLWVSWQKNGKTVRVPAAKLLQQGDAPVKSDEWVYTGSAFTNNGQYMAELDGTLVGFVHDPASIIEHKLGLGLGNYGEIIVRPDLLPAVGSKITMVVKNLEDSE